MDRERIKDVFFIEATDHGIAIFSGDFKKANKIHKKLKKLYVEAKANNFIDVFSCFLDDPNENIRLWAATFMLGVLPDLGKQHLEQLSILDTITGMSAKTTLHLWNENKLNLI